MRPDLIIWSLVLILHCVSGFSVISQANASTLLKRLDSATGSLRAIEVLKLLIKLAGPPAGETSAHPAPDVVETIEEVIVMAAPRQYSARFLNQVQSKSKKIEQLCTDLSFELSSLSWHSRVLFGSSLSKISTNYLNYELQAVQLMKKRLAQDRQIVSQPEIELCLSRCTAALTTSLKTLRLMKTRDTARIRSTIQESFGKIERHVTQEVGRTLAVSMTGQQNTTRLEDHINYLRENLVVIVKSGMFMVFCFTFKIYICSFIFGVLLTMSTVIWIAIFLQLIDV